MALAGDARGLSRGGWHLISSFGLGGTQPTTGLFPVNSCCMAKVSGDVTQSCDQSAESAGVDRQPTVGYGGDRVLSGLWQVAKLHVTNVVTNNST